MSGQTTHRSFCKSCAARGVETMILPGRELCYACAHNLERVQRVSTDETPPLPPAEATPLPAQAKPGASPAGQVEFVRGEIARWEEEGLIPQRLARRLLEQYEPARPGAAARPFSPEEDWPRIRIPMTPGFVLLYLGGILVLCAVILIGAETWKDLGEAGRSVLVGGTTAALFAWAAHLNAGALERRVMAHVLAFFACLATPFALYLLFDLAGFDWSSGEAAQHLSLMTAALSLAAQVGALAWFKTPLLTVPAPFTFLWLIGELAAMVAPPAGVGAELVVHSLIAGGLVLVGIAVALREAGKPAYAVVPEFVGTFTALGSLTALGGFGSSKAAYDAVLVLASLAAIGASVLRHNQTFLFAGALFLMISIFKIAVQHFAGEIGLPLTLLLCGGLCIGLGYGVQRLRREYVLAA